ncbi:MAG: sugar O-acetyltransferase, partial [Pseudomonadota bacterium]
RDPELIYLLKHARTCLKQYNDTRVDEAMARRELLGQLLGYCGDAVWIEPPFQCDFGAQISLGDRVFLNFNCVILDANRVEIGADTVIGPGVHIYATDHPTSAKERLVTEGDATRYLVTSKPVVIGPRCWIGGGAILTAGVTIGAETTIGAGSVVTEPIPEGVLAAGNPCRVIRSL